MRPIDVLQLDSLLSCCRYLTSTQALENVFSTTVILHNLVSSSLATEYQRHESPVLLCVEQALALIPAEMQPAHKPTAPTLPEGLIRGG